MFQLIISVLAIILVVLLAYVSICYGGEAFQDNKDNIKSIIKKFNANKTRLPKWKSKTKLT